MSEALSKLKPGIEHIKTAVAEEALEEGDELDRATMALAVFANIPSLRIQIAKHNGVEEMINLLKASAINSSCNDPTLEIILASCLRTLASVALNGDEDDINKTKIMK